jgi:hypothetical protein
MTSVIHNASQEKKRGGTVLLMVMLCCCIVILTPPADDISLLPFLSLRKLHSSCGYHFELSLSRYGQLGSAPELVKSVFHLSAIFS